MVLSIDNIMLRALSAKVVIPAFNVPYPDMILPIISALKDTESFGLVEVARLEWEKFGAVSLERMSDVYHKYKDEKFTRLHLDHIPVIDEDNKRVDYLEIIKRAIDVGYNSVMVDGSRLPLRENISATMSVVEIAHNAGIPVEAELGAVVGHEEGPIPPYEELYASKKGFTDPAEAEIFVRETGVDWLSVAFGNVHGAISKSRRNEPKISAKLDIEHLRKLQQVTRIPLVLHGGSGIEVNYIREAIANGICKINIGTVIRQVYEKAGAEGVYRAVCNILKDDLQVAGKVDIVNPSGDR